MKMNTDSKVRAVLLVVTAITPLCLFPSVTFADSPGKTETNQSSSDTQSGSLRHVEPEEILPIDTTPNQLTEAEKLSGWELLFDGQSMDVWRTYKRDDISNGWIATNGVIALQTGGSGDLITKEKFDSFELSLQYKNSKGGNSGVIFGVVETDGPPWHSGPEVQIFDSRDQKDAQKSGWLYDLYQPRSSRIAGEGPIDAERPVGEWNELYLKVSPAQSRVCLNGNVYFNFKVGDSTWNNRVANSKFAEYPMFGKAERGHLCLQDHGHPIEFRNIKIRRLDSEQTVPDPVHGELGLTTELAFPNLQWDQWEAIDDAGKIRPLRLIELTYANDDSNRLFTVSQEGQIWVFKNEYDVTKSHLFLDLRGEVKDWQSRGANEQGLLGLAMHPEYKSNGKFYVYYSHPSEGKSLLSCFEVSKDDPNRADPDSEVVLMEFEEPFQNHNGGSIEFGPDGYLYLGLGDGGYRNDPLLAGQDLSKILGTILRIDVDNPSTDKPYGIPADNPFVDVENARPEIYAYGLRNPWRIAFDKQTGRLWCGDVGQDLWEEVNIIRKGGNYGWSVWEATHPFGSQGEASSVSEPIMPVWEYDHGVGLSVTGGRVYRSDRLAALTGKYLYADYVSGSIWALSYDPKTERATRNERVVPEHIPVLGFGEDPSGEIYFLTNSVTGACIYRFK